MVAVFRRGPSNWSHVGRWDVEQHRYEAGAWLKGRIFPRRSDLSPDGRWLCCYVHKPNATWQYGDSYVAVSRLPWLEAVYVFSTCGTWTRGYCFNEDSPPRRQTPLPFPCGLSPFPVEQFAVERRRGWREAPDCPPRDPKDMWDQRRNARMTRPQPGGGRLLCVESVGHAGGELGTGQAVDGMLVRYSLEAGRNLELLDDLQWADWDREGRLLAATRCGKLQVRCVVAGGFETIYEEDLSSLKPDPVPAPGASRS